MGIRNLLKRAEDQQQPRATSPRQLSAGEIGWALTGAVGGGGLGYLMSRAVHGKPSGNLKAAYVLGGACLGAWGSQMMLDSIKSDQGVTLREQMRTFSGNAPDERPTVFKRKMEKLKEVSAPGVRTPGVMGGALGAGLTTFGPFRAGESSKITTANNLINNQLMRNAKATQDLRTGGGFVSLEMLRNNIPETATIRFNGKTYNARHFWDVAHRSGNRKAIAAARKIVPGADLILRSDVTLERNPDFGTNARSGKQEFRVTGKGVQNVQRRKQAVRTGVGIVGGALLDLGVRKLLADTDD